MFAEFGLPEAIRSDNGSSFAAATSGGLSNLSAWWLKLGIRHERIEPGHPEQNGRHERMHLTLKQATASPPERNLKAQQRAFDRFRADYNEVRPHEALGQEVPASFYEPSQRRLPDPPWGRDFEYDDFWETIRVDKLGKVRWNGRSLLITAALRHELLGLEWLGGRRWAVHFGPLLLGHLNTGKRALTFVREAKVSPMSVD